MVHPANEVIDDYIGFIFLCCCLIPFTAEARIFPTFIPNDYLWENHGGKDENGNEKPKWQIYADVIRDIMCKETGLKKCD